jgi:hypothetical protein
MRATFVECPQKFYWSFVRKLGPKEGSPDLMAGGAFAKGLEVARRAFYLEGNDKFRALELGVLAAIEYWGDYDCPPHKQNKSLDRVIEGLAYYQQVWPFDTDYLKPHRWEGGSGIEFTFSLPMELAHPETGDPLIYAGRCDLIGEYNGQLWVVDEKTTSQLGSTWADKWNLRSQFTGYCKAARSFGLPVAGAIVRGISFLKNSFGNAQAITSRPEWFIDRWWEQLHYDAERMIHSWERGYWDFNLDEACTGYGGCHFSRLCLTPDPEPWIDGNYSPRNWNPLDKEPAGKPKQTELEWPVVPMQDLESRKGW